MSLKVFLFKVARPREFNIEPFEHKKHLKLAVYRLVSNLNILFLLKDLSRTELACGPQVSPTATYQEIIQGKNMTLVCTVTSIPEAKISWWYRGLFINNGSTMVSDIGVMFSHRGRLSIFVLLFATNISNNNYVVVGGG